MPFLLLTTLSFPTFHRKFKKYLLNDAFMKCKLKVIIKTHTNRGFYFPILVGTLYIAYLPLLKVGNLVENKLTTNS